MLLMMMISLSLFTASNEVLAAATDIYQELISRFEKHLSLACGADNSSEKLDPVRVDLLKHLVEDNSAPRKLLKAIRTHAASATQLIDNPDSAASREVLESKVALLQRSIKDRLPASEIESRRDQVKIEYQNFHAVQTAAGLSSKLQKKADELKEAKMAELVQLADYSQRLQGALAKAQQCSCRTEAGADQCKDKVTLDDEVKWYGAYKAHSVAVSSQFSGNRSAASGN